MHGLPGCPVTFVEMCSVEPDHTAWNIVSHDALHSTRPSISRVTKEPEAISIMVFHDLSG